MAIARRPAEGAMTLAEMKEFATFSSATQRYIRRSLDIGLDRDDAMRRWSRDVVEAASIRAQARIYDRLPDIRACIPEDSGLDSIEPFMTPLLTVTAFDLGQGRLTTFAAYRFLYERLVGPEARPWLPAAFCAKRPQPPRVGRCASRPFIRHGSKRSKPARRCIDRAAGSATGPAVSALRLIEVEMVAMRGVIVRQEHGREDAARPVAHLAQERGLGGIVTARPGDPVADDTHSPPVTQDESGDVQRVARSRYADAQPVRWS